MNAFNKMLVTSGQPFVAYKSHDMLSSMSCVHLPYSVLTHDLSVVQYVLDCNKGNDNLWVLSPARNLQSWVASKLFLPFSAPYTSQNSSFLSGAPPRCRRLMNEGTLYLGNGTVLRSVDHIQSYLISQSVAGQIAQPTGTTWHERHCEKPSVFWVEICSWFADLALVLGVDTPSENGAPLFQYNVTAGFALLRQGERGASHNVLGLRLEDSHKWSDVIRSQLPGHASFWLCNNIKLGTKKDSLHSDLYRSVQSDSKYKRELRAVLSKCDVFATFYQ